MLKESTLWFDDCRAVYIRHCRCSLSMCGHLMCVRWFWTFSSQHLLAYSSSWVLHLLSRLFRLFLVSSPGNEWVSSPAKYSDYILQATWCFRAQALKWLKWIWWPNFLVRPCIYTRSKIIEYSVFFICSFSSVLDCKIFMNTLMKHHVDNVKNLTVFAVLFWDSQIQIRILLFSVFLSALQFKRYSSIAHIF